MKLLLATHNEHKRREFERLLDGSAPALRWELETLPAAVRLPPEDGLTFAQNALGKARAAARATGRATIADDSGIGAAALGGAPGVRSARYAGEHATDEQNLRKLLREVPADGALEYVCAIAYVDPVGVCEREAGVSEREAGVCERVFEGRCTGRLAAQPRGAGGFGYDPAFLPDDGPAGLTMAELSAEEKDAISHRGRAARALMTWLERNADSAAG